MCFLKTIMKNHNKKSITKQNNVLHHHLLIRLELETCPERNDVEYMEHFLKTLVDKIKMKPLSKPQIFYVDTPIKEYVGLSGIIPIQTSHVSCHFWKYPRKSLLHNKSSKCLLQFDLYTCGTLSESKIKTILSMFNEFKPTHCNLTLINRSKGMNIDKLTKWDAQDYNWQKFITDFRN